MSCFLIIFSWYRFVCCSGWWRRGTRRGSSMKINLSEVSDSIREKKVCNIFYYNISRIMFCWISFLFHIGEEDGCSRRGTNRSGIRRGRRGLRRGPMEEEPGRGKRRAEEEEEEEEHKKRTIKQKVCAVGVISEDMSLILLFIIQLLFSDGWKMEDWDEDSWRMVTWRGTFMWNKKMSMKCKVYIHNLNVCKRITRFIYLP